MLHVSQLEENLSKISKHLDQMGIIYTRTSFPTKDGEVPCLVATHRVRDFDFDLITIASEDWVHVKARVLSLTNEMKNDNDFKAAVYHVCLLGNFYLNEVTFSADDEGNIYVEADMLPDVDHDGFQQEYKSLLVGIDYFLDFLHKIAS